MFSIPSLTNCLCIVVTFNPDDAIGERLLKLADIFEFVLVVDNSCDEDQIEKVAQCAQQLNFCIISNRSNIGLGAALNQGFDVALEKGLQWCVFFDQDTKIYPSFLNSSQASVLESLAQPAIIGNNYLDKHAGASRFPYSTVNTASYKKAKTVITSGSFVSMELYDKIGGFREDYFIDSIDHEYCLRARKHGYNVILSLPIAMEHSLGQQRNGRYRLLSVPEHEPKRKYYIARNIVVTIKTYYSFDKAWCLRQMARLAVEFVCILLFETKKKEKIKATVKGVKYGLAGRMDAYT